VIPVSYPSVLGIGPSSPLRICKLIKEDFVKEDTNAIRILGLETMPAPPAGYRVMFLAFFYHDLSLPIHQFLRALLFAYGVQLQDLNPNIVRHLACGIMLCECFLGSSQTGPSGNASLE
jgi:hypothetical protein